MISYDGAGGIHSADINGDGLKNIVSVSGYHDKIIWYSNMCNSSNHSFEFNTVSYSANGAESAFSVDVDNDGDVDILSASSNDDKIAWYENDGSQNFSTHIISTTADGASSVHANDIDSDGDIDVYQRHQMTIK